ncbi:MAG TPA: glycosyltransferase [Ilumatobacter sp.]|nr:glycosyltransferase [Ilumatobacter sp.]
MVITGIFPPDIGGPATHASSLSTELRARGHDVAVVAATDAARMIRERNLMRVPRRWPWPVRFVAVVLWLVWHRRRYDVIYATGMGAEAVAGAKLARRPVIVKVVGDPAWERGRRMTLTDEGFDQFQQRSSAGLRLRAMRWLRSWTVKRADVVVAPSDYLRRIANAWAPGEVDVRVVPNGVVVPKMSARRSDSAPGDLHAVWVGRLVSHKHVDVLVEAVRQTTGVTLDLIGDGPERSVLEGLADHPNVAGRVRLLGAQEHGDVLTRIAQADVLVSSSSYEGLPHVAIEALVCGTPVVTTPAGGVTEAVTHGVDGLVVDASTPEAFVDAFTRLREDPALLPRLKEGAKKTGEAWRFDHCADTIEALLYEVTRSPARAVFVGKTQLFEPPGPDVERKFKLLSKHLRGISLNTGPVGVRRVGGILTVSFPVVRPGALGGLIFYTFSPPLALGIAASRDGTVIVCQSPYEATGVILLRNLLFFRRPRVLVELHGDWVTAPRLYGSGARRFVAPLTDRVCVWTLRRADRVRVVSEVLAARAREVGYTGGIDRYVTFSDFGVFMDRPTVAPPHEPKVIFVGVLERYKAVDVLLDAWKEVTDRVPEARLVIVGDGSLRHALRERVEAEGLGSSVEFRDPMPREELCSAIDEAVCLVLPSRSEGLPRIVLEAMARGRPVIAAAVGGMAELIDHGVSGYLVAPEDVLGLADDIVRLIDDYERASTMGAAARSRAEERSPVAEYEAGVERLTKWIRGDSAIDRP